MNPPYAVPGGRLTMRGSGFDTRRAHAFRAYVGEARAQITRISAEEISVIVPETDFPASGAKGLAVRVELNGDSSEPFLISMAKKLAGELHPVSNPAFDFEGNLFVTFSGSRGEKVPVSVFKIDPGGRVKPFLSEILNPTGLAFAPDGDLYISSRQEGSVYRVSPEAQAELVADELGIATGLAFDREGILYVGDRQGTIYRIERNGEPRSFCHLPPSVAAYHLAFDREGNLFVTGPSLSSTDPVYRVSSKGEIDLCCTGFGRPQGIAFDSDGNLYVTEALAGDSGVFRIDPQGRRQRIVSSPPLVGLAFDQRGGLVLAGTSSIFHLDLGVFGMPLPVR